MTIIIHLLAAGIAITGIIYGIAVLTVVWALRKVRIGSSSRTVSVSIVIAARNERYTIGNCLAAFADQDYPSSMFEVIIADDRSDDGTSEVINRFQSVLNNFTHIKISEIENGISPKKNALARAIDCAKGDIILQTDADCIPSSKWISGMVSRFEEGIDMVAGIAPYFKETGLLNSFIRHEYLWNASLSAASIAAGHGSHASGRNLAFKRIAFEQLGGYGTMKKVLSGDDTLLLQRFRKSNSASVVTMPGRLSHVYTHAPGTFTDFIRQRIRHMSTGKYFDPFLITLGGFIYGYHILLVFALLFSSVSGLALIIFLSGFFCIFFWDAFTAWRTKAALELDAEWRLFIFNEFLLTLYMAVIPLSGLFIPVTWKEK